MLRATQNDASERTPNRQQRPHRGLHGAAAAVIATSVIALAGCGSSSTNSAHSAAAAAYDKAGNALCQRAHAAVAPLTAHMDAVEKDKELPTLADTKALVAAQAAEQKTFSELKAPASLKAAQAQANSAFAAVVARTQALLQQHGDQMIAYSAIDPQLYEDATTLDAKLKALGLTYCADH